MTTDRGALRESIDGGSAAGVTAAGGTTSAGGAGAVALGVLAITAIPFFAATTFLGDDHVFLAFARHVRNPLAAFVHDLHGGEYYRPLWMAVWWLLAHLGGGSLPFALAALALHAAAAWLVATFLRALGRSPPVARTAAALFFLAPQNLAAAYWFSASTDLLATALVLLSLIALLRRQRLGATVAALAAYLCKESAFVLPLLAAIALGVQRVARAADRSAARRSTWPQLARELGPQTFLLAGVVVVRRMVLHGWGGSGDSRPGLLGAGLQIFGGFAQIFTGADVVPAPLAFAVGATILGLSAWTLARRADQPARFAPFAFAAAAALPLLAAGWAVGARYYYLPSVGIAWAAAEAMAGVGPAARATLGAALVLLGTAQAAARRHDVVSYDQRVAAARRAVAAGLRDGHHVFHVDGGIKDLDLIVKETPALEAQELLVLDDVPASFAILPPGLGAAAAGLVATPPIPPSGAYAFGDVQVIGLARRGDEPDLDEALARFPDLRFIRLRSAAGGVVVARDMTAQITQRLDATGADGQD